MTVQTAEAQRTAIRTAVESIRQKTSAPSPVGIILGTGLGALADEIQPVASISYSEITGFPVSTVESHSGRLIFGTLEGKHVVAMQGRFHRYEGYSMQQVTFPVRVMHQLGVRTLMVSNACGALNPLYAIGDVMLMEDHINLLGDNPLIGPNLDEFGPRFPDMSEPYDLELQRMAEGAALDLRIPLRRGVYVAVTGPNLETRAEYRMLRGMGADVVGMSTVPEVIVARHMSMRVIGLSAITDRCMPDALVPVTLEEVIAAARIAEPKLTAITRAVLARL